MRESYGSDSVRPRVFDLDDPEAVRAAAEPLPVPEPRATGPVPDEPGRSRRAWVSRGVTALVVVAALVVGVFAGLRWQQHRDNARADSALALTVRIGGVAPNLTGSGPVTVDTMVDNRGPRPITILGFSLSAGRWRGVAPSVVVSNTAPTEIDVPIGFPCAAEIPVRMNASIRVRTPDGRVSTLNRSLDSSEEVGDQLCDTTSSAPEATVTSYRSTPAGADVSVRLSAPAGQPTIPNVTVAAPPLTPDPSAKPSGLTIKGGAKVDIVVHLQIGGVCSQGLGSAGLPSALTVATSDANSVTAQTTVALPLALVSSLATRIESTCHGAALP